MFFLTLLTALVSTAGVYGEEPAPPAALQHLEPILQWLPVDSETLIVANGPFEFPSPNRDRPQFWESIRNLPCFLLGEIRRGDLAKQLQGKELLIAVEASRRFKSPAGLGMMPFEGCQILKFEDNAHDVVQAVIDAAFESSSRTVSIGGIKAAVITEKWESDQWTFWIAQPQRGVIVCATQQKFLEQLFERMQRQNVDRAFPDDLPEWKEIDVNSSVWGMRHYDKESAAHDPSSPLRPKSPANRPDAHAIGFVFSYDAKTPQRITARYLTGAPDAVQIVQRGWHNPNEGLTPMIHEAQPGVVEITGVVDEKGSPMFLFVLLCFLGHGIYV